LASGYGYDPTAGGIGQTVAIVDAFDDPSIEKDLGTFDSQYGLALCETANGCFKKVGQTGHTTSLPSPDKEGWSAEISLDVETVRGVCPNCKILLVEANSATFNDLATAVNEAVNLGATEVTNSYGGPEREAADQAAYNHPGVVITASTGDDGYDGWDRLNEEDEVPSMPNAPASLPSVVAVGGTSLHLNPDGTRASEEVWNANGPGDEIGLLSGLALGATGGGCSTMFTAQPWQQNVSGFTATGCGNKRLDADVSAVADPFTGFDIYDSYKCGSYCEAVGLGKGWVTVGGTSLSSPLITSLYALAGGSGGMSYPALTLYGHVGQASSLYDVARGGNGYCGGQPVSLCGGLNGLLREIVDCEGTTACNAVPGFDGPSGVGTPSGLGAFKPLFPAAAITAPSALITGAPASFSASASSDPYPGGSISTYSWNWGDGTATGSGVTPTHTFVASGTYAVVLTVTDNYGLASASSTDVVNVTSSPVNVTGSPAGNSVQKIAGPKLHATPPVPDAKLASTSLTATSSGTVSIKVTCPATESRCTGTVTLRTLNAVIASTAGSKKPKARVLTIASGSFKVAGGKTATVTLRLSAKARTLLKRTHVLQVRATIVAHDSAGATHTRQTTVTIRAAQVMHRR